MSKIEETFKVARHKAPSYRVVHKANGCKVVEGPIPVDDFAALAQAWTKASPQAELVLHDGLAAMLGASFVIGPREACSAWYARLEGAARAPLCYQLVDEPYAGIKCLKCGRTSYNSNDVKYRYCGNCKLYLAA